MTRRSKVYLPRWILWFVGPLMALMWGLMTWEFSRGEMTIAEYTIVTVVLAGVVVVIALMAGGKLPAYEIEHEDDGEAGGEG